MKKYLVKVKMVHVTQMYISEKSAVKAIAKINNVLTERVKHKADLSETFDNAPSFKYNCNLIKDQEKSNV